MKYDDLTLNKLRELSILEVADKLGFKLIGLGDEGRRALCPYHDDKHPSLHFSKKKGIFKCFVCGAKGDLFKLVMDDRNCTFVEACDWLVNEFHMVMTNTIATPHSHCNATLSLQRHTLKERRRERENLTNHTNKKFSNSQILDKTDSYNSDTHSDSFPSKAGSKSMTLSIPRSVIPLNSELVTKSLSLNSEFCKSIVSTGYLTDSQLRHAAARYKLGASKDGGVIFWEIDNHLQVHTGKMMYYQPDCHRDKSHAPTWIHSILKDQLPQNYELRHCLFGLHLLCPAEIAEMAEIKGPADFEPLEEGAAIKQGSNTSVSSVQSVVSNNNSCASNSFCDFRDFRVTKKVCVVESEKSAVILSEKFPDFVWLSCGGLQMFKPELLIPLVDYKIIVFPDTDTTGDTFCCWRDVVLKAERLYRFRYPIRISPLLERHATPDQKRRKIDLVDFLFECPTDEEKQD